MSERSKAALPVALAFALALLVGFFPAGHLGAHPALALDNGLAKTPPMGWNDWNAFGCNVSEKLVKETADAIVASGMKAAGYRYVNIDDCWMAKQRDAQGNLVPDPEKFPDGIKAVADYVHSKGLKLGIYEDAGTSTCAGYPGSYGHEYQDARTFARWGVDYLKYDWCNVPFDQFPGQSHQQVAQQLYTRMRDALAATGRPIVFSMCNGWDSSVEPWRWAQDVSNLWRTTHDIQDSYASMLDIFHQNVGLYSYAKPGAWNDPDMLEVGNGGMSTTEYRSHFSLWAEMAAPLLAGTDLRDMSKVTREIYTNREVIAVDQDPLGRQGYPVYSKDGHWVLTKPLENGDRAVVLFNETDSPATITTTARQVGLKKAPAYILRDLWENRSTETAGTISARVPAHGVVMYRVSRGRPNQASPATGLSVAAPGFVPAGSSTEVTTEFTDYARVPVESVRVGLEVPQGWSATPLSGRTFHRVGTGETVRVRWEISAPTDAQQGTTKLRAHATYRYGNKTEEITAEATTQVPPPPPTSDSYLSDIPWVSASNYWGPVEKDTSNGEQAAGDGHTITINGATYQKGLGTNAPSEISYYLGGNCSRFVSDVGVDDEVGERGSVVFQVFADGRKLYDSGLMTGLDPARSASVDISGAKELELVVTDGGDNPDYDHADWAGARVLCGS